jgi:hypothetical protein
MSDGRQAMSLHGLFARDGDEISKAVLQHGLQAFSVKKS